MRESTNTNQHYSRRELVDRRQSNFRSLCYALVKSRRRAQRRDGSSVTYEDYYEPFLLFLALMLMLLCVLDAYFTLLLLQLGSEELNPLLAWALDEHVMLFFALKYSITAACVILTVVHRNFRVFGMRGTHVLLACVIVYLVLIEYQVKMLIPHLF